MAIHRYINFSRNRCKIDVSMHIVTIVYFLVLAPKIED